MPVGIVLAAFLQHRALGQLAMNPALEWKSRWFTASTGMFMAMTLTFIFAAWAAFLLIMFVAMLITGALGGGVV